MAKLLVALVLFVAVAAAKKPVLQFTNPDDETCTFTMVDKGIVKMDCELESGSLGGVTYEDAIRSLKDEISMLKDTVNDNSADIAALQTAVAKNAKDISENANDIDDLEKNTGSKGFADCGAAKNAGRPSGLVALLGFAHQIYCDMDAEGGPWALVQTGKADCSTNLRTSGAAGGVVKPINQAPRSAKLSRADMLKLCGGSTCQLKWGRSSTWLFAKDLDTTCLDSNGCTSNGATFGYNTAESYGSHKISSSYNGETWPYSRFSWSEQAFPHACLNHHNARGECSSGCHIGTWSTNSCADRAYYNDCSHGHGAYEVWVKSPAAAAPPAFTSCSDAKASGHTTGLTKLTGFKHEIYCDMDSTGGSWALVQSGKADCSTNLRTSGAAGGVVMPFSSAARSAKLSRADQTKLCTDNGRLRADQCKLKWGRSGSWLFARNLHSQCVGPSGCTSNSALFGYNTAESYGSHRISSSYEGQTWPHSRFSWSSDGFPHACLNHHNHRGECSSGCHIGTWGTNSCADHAYYNDCAHGSGAYDVYVQN